MLATESKSDEYDVEKKNVLIKPPKHLEKEHDVYFKYYFLTLYSCLYRFKNPVWSLWDKRVLTFKWPKDTPN